MGRPELRWEDNIRTDLGGRAWIGVSRSGQGPEADSYNTVMKLLAS